MGLNIFFDVDDTIISYLGELRPHVREVFQQLKADGHTIYLWSGLGIRTEVVEEHGLEDLVSACYWKPRVNYADALQRFRVPMVPDFVIDDHVGVVDAFGGVQVRPYGGAAFDGDDVEMQRVYEAILDRAQRAIPAAEQGRSR